MPETPRDPRASARIITLDLSCSLEAIHADLRVLYPRSPGMWWEIDEGGQTGWVYTGDNTILAKLQHAAK